jgi:hypothetical protein
MSQPSTFLLISLVLCVAGCGNGGSGPVIIDGSNPPSRTVSRALPGVVVGASLAGGGRHQVTLTTEQTVAALVLLAGTDHDTAVVLPVIAGSGAWTVEVPAGAQLLARITLADGSVAETAPGDLSP